MSSSTEPEASPSLLEVGRICKPHGLRGEVVVDLSTDRSERVDVGSCLQTGRGPVNVRASRPHQHRYIVTFAEIASREDAEGWRNVTLHAEPLDDPDVFWVHDLIGSVVVTVDGVRCGIVESVIDNPAADLLALDDGRLIPVVFIVDDPQSIRAERTVVIDPPDGLLDL